MAIERLKNEDLVEKMSKLNTNKKLRRRDKKIGDYKSQIVGLQKDNESQVEQLAKLEKRLEHSQHTSDELPVTVLLRRLWIRERNCHLELSLRMTYCE